jgi:hypothetical protein
LLGLAETIREKVSTLILISLCFYFNWRMKLECQVAKVYFPFVLYWLVDFAQVLGVDKDRAFARLPTLAPAARRWGTRFGDTLGLLARTRFS